MASSVSSYSQSLPLPNLCTLGLHAPGLVLLQSETTARLGEWQSVTISRVEGSASITFQGRTTRSVSPSPTHAAVLLDTHTEVFIGELVY